MSTGGGHLLINEASASDIDDVADLLTQFFQEEGFELPPSGLEPRVRTYVSLDDHAIFIAKVDGGPVGVCTVAAGFSLEYGWYAEMEDLYVVPPRRGGGIARALNDAVTDWAIGASCTAMLVTITPGGQARHDLRAFYARLGFEDDGRGIMERRIGSKA